MLVINVFLYEGHISSFSPVIVAFSRKIGIYGSIDTRATGRFLDIIIARCRVYCSVTSLMGYFGG